MPGMTEAVSASPEEHVTDTIEIWQSACPGYQLLDSGHGRKLEKIAGVMVDRPSPQAIWSPRLGKKRWQQATSQLLRDDDGGGSWQHQRPIPDDLTLRYEVAQQRLRWQVKFTAFGHCGIFFEQVGVWQRIVQAIRQLQAQGIDRPVFVNLFSYTGCASLIAAAAGAQVYSVDSAKGVLNWGKANAAASGLPDEAIRWVQLIAAILSLWGKKKGFTYDLVLADPPAWGHGKGRAQRWQFEDDASHLVADLAAVLAPGHGRMWFNTHTPGVQATALSMLLVGAGLAKVSAAELAVPHANDQRLLPGGVIATGCKQ